MTERNKNYLRTLVEKDLKITENSLDSLTRKIEENDYSFSLLSGISNEEQAIEQRDYYTEQVIRKKATLEIIDSFIVDETDEEFSKKIGL